MQKRILSFFVGVLFVMQTALPIYADDAIGDVSESGEIISADLYENSVNEQIDNSADTYSYEYDLSEISTTENFTDVSGSYTTDISKPFDGNWHIISWETAKPVDSTWSYGGNHTMESDDEFIYVTGGVPKGSAITNFSIDVTTSIEDKKIVDIYASDSLNGTWTTLSYTDSNISLNDVGNPEGNKVAKKIDLSFDKSLGYRYIKIKKNANSSGEHWLWMLGGFSFEWEGIPDVTVDYAKDGNSLKATVKLVNQSDFLPFIVFAGYDSEGTLLKASYHSEGLLNGSKKIEYVIPSKDISKARLFVWNQENLSPAATLGDFNAAK